MIKQKTYFMLLVSAFTFFGLSAIQNVSYFTDFFGEVKITFNTTIQQEENGSSNSQEVKESKAKSGATIDKSSVLAHSNVLFLIAFQEHKITHKSTVLEVATPPPELFIV